MCLSNRFSCFLICLFSQQINTSQCRCFIEHRSKINEKYQSGNTEFKLKPILNLPCDE